VGPGSCPFTSTFTVLSSAVQVAALDSPTREPGTWITLNANEQIAITGCSPPPPPRMLSPAQLKSLADAFHCGS
jgi:hypothetical protein